MNYKKYDASGGHGSAKQWRSSFNKRVFNHEEIEIMSAWNSDTPYTILGVSPSASKEAIKKAYRKKAMECHPDRNPDRQEWATEEFKKISLAYELLS